ncbi:hypothetical protein VSH64_36020 [Amycolatopsis rhabdoformis]|uniref:Uncharacterized protein n=1 Tax=Amycolatopsis rhabdoformis TaxID=1448059 RepID=A0ABZ1I3S4_9PSEU|nr:hypothetical protein [Amycolatopsis rhabdoformis]WSE28208.1 hypothetical protein VSH64_36020 [Amycolatopsis rhabdoformis]
MKVLRHSAKVATWVMRQLGPQKSLGILQSKVLPQSTSQGSSFFSSLVTLNAGGRKENVAQ